MVNPDHSPRSQRQAYRFENSSLHGKFFTGWCLAFLLKYFISSNNDLTSAMGREVAYLIHLQSSTYIRLSISLNNSEQYFLAIFKLRRVIFIDNNLRCIKFTC